MAAGRTLAAAESCTGGLAAQLITAVPGSSAYFLGGIVAYSGTAKNRLLGVKTATIAKHGSVSAQCAREMALGARNILKSDYSFSITGVAGPGGGTRHKPVGLVYFCLAAGKKAIGYKRMFSGGRGRVRTLAANFILERLAKVIE
ncbi:MAG: hypothetical protein A2285_10725 [Elusimicrobia bacterium RIFOXYA12_FULL_57_11]|nr:MAG: hypothetical protein A2285_10725 [Elusimicrobia bacterium RIFOXYA12_FULL_57_11]